jgi:hypothetical protein
MYSSITDSYFQAYSVNSGSDSREIIAAVIATYAAANEAQRDKQDRKNDRAFAYDNSWNLGCYCRYDSVKCHCKPDSDEYKYTLDTFKAAQRNFIHASKVAADTNYAAALALQTAFKAYIDVEFKFADYDCHEQYEEDECYINGLVDKAKAKVDKVNAKIMKLGEEETRLTV